MRMLKREILVLALLATGLHGCGGKEKPQPEASGGVQEKIEEVVSNIQEKGAEVLEDIVKDVEEKVVEFVQAEEEPVESEKTAPVEEPEKPQVSEDPEMNTEEAILAIELTKEEEARAKQVEKAKFELMAKRSFGDIWKDKELTKQQRQNLILHKTRQTTKSFVRIGFHSIVVLAMIIVWASSYTVEFTKNNIALQKSSPSSGEQPQAISYSTFDAHGMFLDNGVHVGPNEWLYYFQKGTIAQAFSCIVQMFRAIAGSNAALPPAQRFPDGKPLWNFHPTSIRSILIYTSGIMLFLATYTISHQELRKKYRGLYYASPYLIMAIFVLIPTNELQSANTFTGSNAHFLMAGGQTALGTWQMGGADWEVAWDANNVRSLTTRQNPFIYISKPSGNMDNFYILSNAVKESAPGIFGQVGIRQAWLCLIFAWINSRFGLSEAFFFFIWYVWTCSSRTSWLYTANLILRPSPYSMVCLVLTQLAYIGLSLVFTSMFMILTDDPLFEGFKLVQDGGEIKPVSTPGWHLNKVFFVGVAAFLGALFMSAWFAIDTEELLYLNILEVTDDGNYKAADSSVDPCAAHFGKGRPLENLKSFWENLFSFTMDNYMQGKIPFIRAEPRKMCAMHHSGSQILGKGNVSVQECIEPAELQCKNTYLK